ncbi:MAG: hypothetical protein QOC82_2164 [Frankiaceae bacterium]|jgi:hypothetical protein|nr:hypothetical protein [Frankiaceae bacterium]
MRDTRTNWLWIGVGLLLVSLFAAFMTTSGLNNEGSRDSLVIESWVERSAFWLGLLFVAGYLLDSITAGRGR